MKEEKGLEKGSTKKKSGPVTEQKKPQKEILEGGGIRGPKTGEIKSEGNARDSAPCGVWGGGGGPQDECASRKVLNQLNAWGAKLFEYVPWGSIKKQDGKNQGYFHQGGTGTKRHRKGTRMSFVELAGKKIRGIIKNQTKTTRRKTNDIGRILRKKEGARFLLQTFNGKPMKYRGGGDQGLPAN